MNIESGIENSKLTLNGLNLQAHWLKSGEWVITEKTTGQKLKDSLYDWREMLLEMGRLHHERFSSEGVTAPFDRIAHRVMDQQLAAMSPEEYTAFCESRVVEFESFGEFKNL